MKKRHSILFLLIFYFFFQLSSIDYGFKINDINYLKNISLSKLDIKAFTEKESINTKENIETDSKSWEYRYKLYSVNADEMMPIMALSKIDINKTQKAIFVMVFLVFLGTFSQNAPKSLHKRQVL